MSGYRGALRLLISAPRRADSIARHCYKDQHGPCRLAAVVAAAAPVLVEHAYTAAMLTK